MSQLKSKNFTFFGYFSSYSVEVYLRATILNSKLPYEA